MYPDNIFPRDLSWLSFNGRVLQEAKDYNNPLYERIKFMAIYSSNLDEFFRVRMATLRRLILLKKKTKKALDFSPEKLLKRIMEVVDKQQNQLGDIYNNIIVPELKKYRIYLLNEDTLDEQQSKFVKKYFLDNVKTLVKPIFISDATNKIFLEDKHLYLAIELFKNATEQQSEEHALVEIPTKQLPRFIVIPGNNQGFDIIFLDDIVRYCLKDLFLEYTIKGCYSIKLSRDADIDLGDEFSGDLISKIRKSLKKREKGVPSRLLYQESMPKSFLKIIRKALSLSKEDLVPGAKYHNFSDFFSFPNPGKADLEFEPFPALSDLSLDKEKSIFKAIQNKDIVLHFPYQSYDYVTKFLSEAAEDKAVKSIKITLYRMADNSEIADALIKAAKNGKEVITFVEVKARFDEASNLGYAKKFEKAGVNVLYSIPDLKVHSKIFVIKRTEGEQDINYAYLGTGNFNEKSARIYCDHGLFTMDPRLTDEVDKVFQSLEQKKLDVVYNHLLVAPYSLRKGLNKLIGQEMENASKGKKAYMILKMNSLEDTKMIKKLYKASQAGVKIKIILRGICCLIPGVSGLSENIKVNSILDRYLEHARIYIFCNEGKEKMYIASADLMKRNLDRRVEIAFPIYDKSVYKEIRTIIKLQLNDNTKRRKINKIQNNPYSKSKAAKKIRSQFDTFKFIKQKVSKKKQANPVV